MRAVWRLLVVWLTVLAMPVQGMAAVAMLHCAGGGVHAHVLSGHAADGHAHAGVDAATTAETATTHAADASVEASAKAPLPAAGHTCSACAACGPGAGLPVATLTLPGPVVAASPMALPGPRPTSFIAGGPERPPRSPRT